MNTKKYILSATSMLVSAAMMLNTTIISAENSVQDQEYTDYIDTVVTLEDTGYSVAAVMSNADSGFLFRDQLDANNLCSYQVFEEYLASPSDSAFTVELSEEIVVGCSSRFMNNWSEDEYSNYANAILSAVMPGIISCTLDYPELFWLNFAEIGCGLSSGGYTYESGTDTKWNMIISEIIVTPNHDTNYTDMDEVLEIREDVLLAAENYVIEGETDYEKCKSIYNSIIDTTSYDTSAPYAHGLAGVLYDTYAVCEGYAKTFKYLCDRENIPCITVLGNYNEETLTAHMWNYVYLDGEWYGCDPTFDESTGSDTYFMKGSASFNLTHQPESPYSIMSLSFPELAVDDYVPDDVEVTTTTTITTTDTTSTTTTVTETDVSTDPYTTTSFYDTTTNLNSSTYTQTAESTTTQTISLPETSSDTTRVQTTTTTVVTDSTTELSSATTLKITSTNTTSSASATTVITEPEILYGDTNGDGTITVIDIIRLRKYIVNVGHIIPDERFDFNQDGNINIFDVTALMRWMLYV